MYDTHFDIALFMYEYNSNTIPTSFHKFFTCIKEIHQYSTRLAAKQIVLYP